jgi:hypothetical protein
MERHSAPACQFKEQAEISYLQSGKIEKPFPTTARSGKEPCVVRTGSPGFDPTKPPDGGFPESAFAGQRE